MGWSSPAAVAGLAAVSLLPLAVTAHSCRQPAAAVVGLLLALALARLTLNPAGAAVPARFDAAKEQQALKNVVMTSSTNRTVRMGLGAVYAYTAVAFSWHALVTTAAERGAGGGAAAAVTRVVLAWVGCFVDLRIGFVWGSSGFCGQ